jgi:glycerophosphoryl diester phosphodiesterase
VNRHPFLREGRAHVLAHRGASAAHPPGNTVAAFQHALDVGADHLETDVQATGDGVVVVFHDDRLDEVTTGTGRIADHRWSELEPVRYVVDGRPTDQGLVTLDDALSRFPRAYLNVDVKTDDTVAPAVRVLQGHDARRRVCVAAFDDKRVRRLRRDLGAGWCTALARWEIVVARIASWLRLRVPVGGDVAQVPRRHSTGVSIVDRRFVDACHRSGIAVHVWTIDDPATARELFDLGVDGVITDRPDRFVD